MWNGTVQNSWLFYKLKGCQQFSSDQERSLSLSQIKIWSCPAISKTSFKILPKKDNSNSERWRKILILWSCKSLLSNMACFIWGKKRGFLWTLKQRLRKIPQANEWTLNSGFFHFGRWIKEYRRKQQKIKKERSTSWF